MGGGPLGGGVGRGGRVVGVRVDVNEELNFFWKIQKKIEGEGAGESGWGVRMDVN